MEVSGQRHAPADLLPGKKLGTHCIGGWVSPVPVWMGTINLALNRDSIPHTETPMARRLRNPQGGSVVEAYGQTFFPYLLRYRFEVIEAPAARLVWSLHRRFGRPSTIISVDKGMSVMESDVSFPPPVGFCQVCWYDIICSAEHVIFRLCGVKCALVAGSTSNLIILPGM